MKKSALMAAVLAATTLSSTAFAAQNPFKDLPEGHWAYDAVTMLAEDGVLEGYGDGTFRGTKTMNRYEMAQIVAKAMEKYDNVQPKDKGAINKLKKEFANELKDMDVRLKNVENDVQEIKKGMSSFKWWGDARVRRFQNKKMSDIEGEGKADERNNKNELRMRLGFYGEPAKQLSVTGQLKFESDKVASSNNNGGHEAANNNDGKYYSYEKVGVNRLQLDWHAKNDFTFSIGRNELTIGQGLIYWENPIDSIMVRKTFNGRLSLLAGYGDAAPATYSPNTEYALFADAKYKVSPAVNVSVTYYKSHSDATGSLGERTGNPKNFYMPSGKWTTVNERKIEQIAYGFNAQLAPKWNLVAEGIHNSADVKKLDTAWAGDISSDRNGWWTRLTYGKLKWDQGGTWNVYAEYMRLGGLAVDSSGWTHHLNVAGGNGYGGAGARGFGLAANYMLAANTNLELAWYKLKPVDSSSNFNGYKDTSFAALTYSF